MFPQPLGTGTRASTPEAKPSFKPKTKPSITPRTFKRFFTPCHRVRNLDVGASRSALGDLAPSSVNNLKHSSATRRLVSRGSERIFDHGENGVEESHDFAYQENQPQATDYYQRSKRRKLNIGSRGVSRNVESTHATITVSEAEPCLPKPIRRSLTRETLGENLFRELSWARKPGGIPSERCSIDARFESSGFFSSPQDIHTCQDIFNTGRGTTLPFCVTACNTNSLVAVGDEDGAIRLLETQKSGPPCFHKSYLAVRSHQNAILDMAFSTDDTLLATASGDQTCHIIDMPTQQSTYTLNGHSSSVKQIKFQPGSCNSVLATSGRDGCIQMWDLRCSGPKGPALEVSISHGCRKQDNGSNYQTKSTVTQAACTNVFNQAHVRLPSVDSVGGSGRQLPQPRSLSQRSITSQARNEISVTTISFLSSDRSNILLSGCEAEAMVKVWDLRTIQSSRRRAATPLSITRQPSAHHLHRHFGLTSMAVGGDGNRLYTLCKDNTIYAYSTAHLVLGSSPVLEGNIMPRRLAVSENDGPGPIYGFRHPNLKVSTFYVKLALRRAFGDRPEMIATGSTSQCSILFPSHQQSFGKATPSGSQQIFVSDWASNKDEVPIYEHGTQLIRGHDKEVTAVAWSSEGDLVTSSDDGRCRVWRRDCEQARRLRTQGEADGLRWKHGWAEDCSDSDD